VTVVALGDQTSELEIDEADIDYQVTRGSGAGGQHRNKVETAVRAVHRPTGTRVFVQTHKSQWKNRQAARAELISRLASVHEGEQLEQARMDKAAGFERSRDWLWVEWRDTVTDPAGTRMSMSRALRGRFK
jgi:protein subunit release factor B